MEKFQNPFPPLHLGPQDQQELETLAAGLVEVCVAQFAQHLEGTRAQGQLDPLRWKHVKSREDVHVYQERQGFVSAEDGNESGLPMLQGVGTIVGDLDDVMYGVVNSSLDSMRIKTTYVDDKIVNAAVLASLIEPSVSDPFRCLAVKWSVTGGPALIRSFFKNRDSVYLESTGISALGSGERIGYQLLHSVQFPHVGPAPGSDTVRANISMCCVYRQAAHNVVQLFMRGFLDPAGGVVRAIVTTAAAEVMVSVWKNVHCAQLKKLAWAIRQRRQRRQTLAVESTSAQQPALGTNRGTCALCSKKSLLGTSRIATCRLCLVSVCRSCRIRKALSFFGADRELIQQRIAFCIRCFTRVVSTSACSVACDEILANDAFRGHPSGGVRAGVPSASLPSSSASYSISSSSDDRY